MIINLRGTNGSGKSTVARALMGTDPEEVELAEFQTPAGKWRQVIGYRNPALGLIVVGPYRTDCGGCDGVKTQDLICEAVTSAAKDFNQHVFFEGVIVSTLFSRYAKLADELGRDEFVFAYLDTPLAVCLKRIQKRNGGKPIKEDLVADKVRAINSTRHKADAAGYRVEVLPYRSATERILEMINEDR